MCLSTAGLSPFQRFSKPSSLTAEKNTITSTSDGKLSGPKWIPSHGLVLLRSKVKGQVCNHLSRRERAWGQGEAFHAGPLTVPTEWSKGEFSKCCIHINSHFKWEIP